MIITPAMWKHIVKNIKNGYSLIVFKDWARFGLFGFNNKERDFHPFCRHWH